MDDDRIVDTASRIADGQPVDWAGLREAGSPELLAELAVLDKIAAVHRQLHTLLPAAATTEHGASWAHLELIEEIGRGSFGIVYRALDTHLHREVALKLYRDAGAPLAVIEEGRRLARIAHPNVVTVFGADIIDGMAGIWMEFVRGQRLDEVVRTSGPFSAREAALVGGDLARALAAVHGAGLVHRDVKAQNAMREAGGRIVLMDLGASGFSSSLTSTAIAGTPLYMAPELLDGEDATAATDIYSLGVLLFFLVTGTFPVTGRTVDEIRLKHHGGQRRRIVDARPDIDPAFARVVERAIEPHPSARFASAGEFAAALAQVTAIVVPAPPQPARRPRWALVAAGVAVLALLTVGIAVATRTRTATSPIARAQSLGVLPIRNLTGNDANAYLADGLTEVIIANLATLPGIRVPSSAATNAFRSTNESPAAIAGKLGVDVLLAGSVTEAADRIRLNVQLIEPATGRVMWGQELIRTRATVLSAQSEVARTVAAQLAIPAGEARAPTADQALSADAQDAYLHGLVEVNSQIQARYASGIDYFKRAVSLDPGFAAAWAELALAELRGIESGDWRERTDRARQVREHALRAIELDPGHASGYVALASVQFYHDWDFTAADATFRRALDVAPSHSFARMRYAYLLAARGRLQEAIRQAVQARDLEPLLPVRSTAVGIFRYYARDYDGALREMQRALDLNPSYAAAHFGMGRIYSAMGRHDDAIAHVTTALKGGRNPGWIAELAHVYAAAGHRSDLSGAMKELSELEEHGAHASVDNLGYIALADGRVDDAFRYLNEAIDRRMTNVLWLPVDPRVDPIRQDPRFPALLTRMSLKP